MPEAGGFGQASLGQEAARDPITMLFLVDKVIFISPNWVNPQTWVHGKQIN